MQPVAYIVSEELVKVGTTAGLETEPSICVAQFDTRR